MSIPVPTRPWAAAHRSLLIARAVVLQTSSARAGRRTVTISPLRAMGSVDTATPRVSGVAWERSRQGPTAGTDAGDRTTTRPTETGTGTTSDVPVTCSTTSTTDPRAATAPGESLAKVGETGIPGSILALCRRPIRERGSVR
jgi:hypothetical protein